jgi:2'-phosphotransferase
MSRDGYVLIQDVVDLLTAKHVPNISVQCIVDEAHACPKRRFQLSPCGELIRASQGHSIRDVDDVTMLVKITDGATVHGAVHGTSLDAWESIRVTGLRCGRRNHIHIATTGCTSGYKIGGAGTVLIHIDVVTAMAAGIVFYLAPNGVVLTRGVQDGGVLPVQYFRYAERCEADGSRTRLDSVT